MARLPKQGESRGELALIEGIRARAAALPRSRSLRLGIGDDCAILQPPTGHEVLVTTDFSLEGRHFRRDLHPARAVGHRCLARGLSDLAAMGALPLSAFLSLALPSGAGGPGNAWINGFLDGLLVLARATGTPLAGGDTAAAPGAHVLADIVLLGSAPKGTALRRSGAAAGDLLYVTGNLGGAAAEWAALQQNPRRFRPAQPDGPHPHLFPEPRLRVGALLRSRGLATAAIDVSDGISTDLRHLCDASGVGAGVEAELLPIHPQARSLPDAGLSAALHGGEDYELLFAAKASTAMPRTLAGVALHRIGRLTRSREILLLRNGRAEPLPRGGWEHAL